jgi:hypothetical protein
MTDTQLSHYEVYNRVTVPPELREHVETALQNAEDDFIRELGASFFDAETEVAGRDWLRIVSYRAAEYVRITDPTFRDAMDGPFQSETQGRWSYTLKTPSRDVADNPIYKPILDHYRGFSSPVRYRGRSSITDEYAR